jgi:AcrR family transcriptional regulator
MNDITQAPSGQRGPQEHSIRDQIIEAAGEHFSHFGYGKTTVSDLAKAIGFSKAYIYKFFDSKQAIGEAICAQNLAAMMAKVHDSMAGSSSATDRLRRLFDTLTAATVEQFFEDRRLYDITAYSVVEKWRSSLDHDEQLKVLLAEIVRMGRESGEFERKTPMDELVRAILLAMQPFTNPLLLQYNLDLLPHGPREVVNLILRSLAP